LAHFLFIILAIHTGQVNGKGLAMLFINSRQDSVGDKLRLNLLDRLSRLIKLGYILARLFPLAD
jgi:hypothetical protein